MTIQARTAHSNSAQATPAAETKARRRLAIGNTVRSGGGTSSRSVFALAFLAFFLLAAAWSFAMPYDGPADELQHTVRAYGVLSGHIMPNADAQITVPHSLAPNGLVGDQPCVRWHLETTAACATSPDANPADRTTMVVTTSGAANYNPVYYALVGLPIKISPDYLGIISARLLTGLMTSALFAGAVTVAVRISRGRGPLLFGGVLTVITPVAINMTGAVNPAGLEIAAGVGLWAALLAIVYERDDSRWVLALFGVSAILLCVLREFGIGWLAASLAVAAFGLSKKRLKELSRLRAARLWAAAVTAAGVFGVVWILASTQGGIGAISDPTPTPHGAALWVHELTHRIPYYTSGLVGLTSYGGVAIPLPLILVWFGAVGLLLVQAVRKCGRRVGFQISAIVLGAYAILVLADVQAASHGWWLSQGRYALPLLAGAPLLAAHALSRQRAVERRRQDRLVRVFAVVLLPMQGVALWITMIRFQHAFDSKHPRLFNLFGDTPSINPFTGAWTPPLGAIPSVVLCIAGIVALGLLVKRLTKWHAIPAPRDGSRTTGRS